jgi:hypothetical protein
MKAILFIPIVFAIVIGCCCASTPATNSSPTRTTHPTNKAYPTLWNSSPTRTAHPTYTTYPTDIPVQPNTNSSSGYVSLLGHIYSGVEVYYGANKAYGFQILGGVDDCSYFPSGQGIRVQYPDGTEEWKDREYLVSSGLFYIKDNDPAVDRMEWYIYNCP